MCGTTATSGSGLSGVLPLLSSAGGVAACRGRGLRVGGQERGCHGDLHAGISHPSKAIRFGWPVPSPTASGSVGTCAAPAGALGSPAQRGGSQRAGHTRFPPLLPGAAEVSGRAPGTFHPREPRAGGTRSAEPGAWGCVLAAGPCVLLRSAGPGAGAWRRPHARSRGHEILAGFLPQLNTSLCLKPNFKRPFACIALFIHGQLVTLTPLTDFGLCMLYY